MTSVRTTCRICESRCGVLVETDGDRVLGIKADGEHPISRGHACGKGLHFGAVHHSEDRLRSPRLNGADCSWEEALTAVGGQLRELISQEGPGSIAIYSGNAAGHSLGTVLGVSGLKDALGGCRYYTALTLDNAEQFVVLDAVLGTPLHAFAADFAGCDLALLIGTDMLASQPAQNQSNPRGIGHLRDLASRGHLWVLDPRPSRTATAGRHLACRPGGDVAVLGWLLREALSRGVSDDRVRDGDFDQLALAVQGFDLQGATSATGLAGAELEALREALFAAERPIVWSGLGVLLGRDGTLGYWLTLALQLALGGLDRPGGWCTPPGADLGGLATRIGLRGSHETLRGRHGHPATLDTLPAADLAEDIAAGQVKALIVVGGNPALSLPNHEAAVEALRSLDLLVAIDLFNSDTATLAHVALPACSWLAREDLPAQLDSLRWADGELPPLAIEPAAVSPVGDARPDAEILLDLGRAAGGHAFGSRLADQALRRIGATRLGLWASKFLGRSRPLGPTRHADGRIHLAVPKFVEALAEWSPPRPGLALVTSVRPVETMNHWLHHTKASQRRRPVARIHPETALIHGVKAGSVTLVGAERIHCTLEFDAGLARDTVVLPYGWGHLPGAAYSGGINANALIDGIEREPFTGQPVSNGQLVQIESASHTESA